MHNRYMTASASPSTKGKSKAPAPARWGQDRRLEFIDFRLRWDGRINRSDLTAFFGISVPQASLDIAKYLSIAPKNTTYDKSSKVYVAASRFQPVFPANEPDRFLNELLARTAGVLQPELSFLGWAPPVGLVSTPSRTLSAKVLTSLLAAIRGGTKARILYQSMSSNEPAQREISPHALAHDGFRWHARAFCDTRVNFLDFVIARILDVTVLQDAGVSAADDAAWNLMVRLVLMPNPAMPPANRKVIELDYGMKDGTVALECRKALLYYALKRLGLSAEPKDVIAAAQQIVLKNRSEVEPHLPTGTGPR